jgi:polysaccharide export outer membrane protein
MTHACRRVLWSGVLVALAGTLPACHWDSFFDPSTIGRWEETPAVVPILEHLAPIETDDGALVEYTEVSVEDLQVQTEAYNIAAADEIRIEVYDVVAQGQVERYDRVVDQNGYIEVPQLGRVFISGLTEEDASDLLKRRFGQFVADPLVSVVILTRRAQSYNLQGAVGAPGRYQIPSSDYRLLEALIAGGGVDPNIISYVHVIRQVPLSDELLPARQEAPSNRGTDPTQTPLTPPPQSGEELIDIINDLTGEEGGGAPAVMGGGERVGSIAMVQPGDEPEPVIDLIEEETRPVVASPADQAARAAGGGRWLFINGEWVRGYPSEPTTRPGGQGGPAGTVGDRPLVTQRVIRVPVDPLLAGDARYNIVVRPGDVISVPPPEQGNIYLAGQVQRPGVYQLPAVGRLTLYRAITAAGGLGGIAIPERVDLTRMVGPDRQATIMLDMRSIAEGTQPDVFLKPDDHINVGTNFWALPLAVVRNGFRASYGFGFLLDRNFGNDVFGPPPTNIR